MINNTLVCTTIVRMRGANLCAHAYYYLRLFHHMYTALHVVCQ